MTFANSRQGNALSFLRKKISVELSEMSLLLFSIQIYRVLNLTKM